MKLKCNRVKLSEAVQLASSVVPAKSTVPALANIKLVAHSGAPQGRKGAAAGGPYLELTATDLEVGIRYTVPLESLDTEGTLVIPAGRLGGILRESGDESIKITSDGNLAHIECSDSTYKMVGADPADYPTLPEEDPSAAVPVDSKELREMIRKTQFSTSSEIVRYALTGQLLEIKGKEIRMVASDGKRLAYIKRKIQGGKAGSSAVKDVKVLVPPKAFTLLDRVLTDEDETVSLHVEDTQIHMKTQRAAIFSRLIEGNFPDYEAVVPQDRDKKIRLNTEPLFSAVRRTSLMTSDKGRAVKFTLSKNKLTLFARAQDVGEAKVDLPIEYSGGDFEIVFNPDFLADFLKVVGEETLELGVQDKTTAGVLKAGKDYVYVLMPLTVNV